MSSIGGTWRRGKAGGRSTGPRSDDDAIVAAALVYALLAAVAWLVQSDLGFRTPWPVASITGIFAVHLLLIRRSLNDPIVIFVIVMFLYSYLPTVADISAPGSTLGFDLALAYDLFNVGQIATMVGVAVSCSFMKRDGPPPTLPAVDSTACLVGGIVSGILAIILISAAIAVRGYVLGGGVSYGESFTQQTEAGNGIYMLCVPFCLASIGLILASRHPLAGYALAIPVFCFIEIAVGIGQRKYFIQPALFIFAFYWTSRRLYQTIAIIAGAVFAFMVFCYLGFLRINALGIEAVLSPAEWANFFSDLGVYVGSETVYLYATAASAVTGFVRPLDYGADYLMAWALSFPRFLMTDALAELYTSANDRFTYTYDALAADFGQGYGFSFLGESYLVGGLPGTALMVVIQICLFRYVYLRGGGNRPTGVWGAVSLLSLYFAMWTQRNALGVIIREFIVFVVGAIVLMYYAGHITSRIVLPTMSKIHRETKRSQDSAVAPAHAEPTRLLR